MEKYFYNNMRKTSIINSDKDAIMEKLKKVSENYKNIIDGLANKNSKLQNENNKLKKDLDKYNVRHTGNVDAKNCQAYEYKLETKKECKIKLNKFWDFLNNQLLGKRMIYPGL